jgi:DnaJ-class molecular chaperone
MKCNICKGEKYVVKKANIPCKDCKETGIFVVNCFACEETGLFTTKNGKRVFCRKCKGTGKYSTVCKNCVNGIIKFEELIICPACKGTGEKKKRVFNGIRCRI